MYLLLLLFGFVTAETLKGTKRPHIVFVLGDDVGFADASFRGASQIPTPNMDALAADGVILNNYYVQPFCSPSRAALMSGWYPFRTGMQHFPIKPAEPRGLPLDLKLMPEYFRDLGYQTHMVGKWHLGYYRKEYTPIYRGFDSFYGFYNGEIQYYNHTEDTNGLHTGLDFWLNETPLRNETGKYATTLYAQRVKHLISTRDKSKPLFLYVSNQAAHSAPGSMPFQAPAENVNKFPHIGEENRAIYAGMMDVMDQSIGQIFEYLNDARMLENTIFVYSSDNGGTSFGAHGSRGFNWPLRGSKATLWEGGVRVGAFLWSPLLKKTPRISNQMMHIVDWMITLYAAAGGNTRAMKTQDGINLWHQLSKDLPSPRMEFVYNINPIENYSAIRQDNYKLVQGITPGGMYDERLQVPGGAGPYTYKDLDDLMAKSSAANVLKRFHGTKAFVYPPNWRKMSTLNCGRQGEGNFVPGEPPYLFDIEKDPCELNNLAASKPYIVRQLQRRLDNYAATQVMPLNQPDDPRAYPEYHDGLWEPWED